MRQIKEHMVRGDLNQGYWGRRAPVIVIGRDSPRRLRWLV
jgi:hypothetical protein